MTQDQNQDGNEPFQPSPHSTPESGGFHDSAPAQPGGDESWLLEDAGDLEASAMQERESPAPDFGAPPVGEVDPHWNDPTLDGAGAGWSDPSAEGADAGESWLLDAEGEPTGDEPAPFEPVAAEAVAGDAPSVLEASYVSADPMGRARGLLVPVTLGALALVGGFAMFQMGGGSGASEEAPEAVAVTGDRSTEIELAAPTGSYPNSDPADGATRRSIGRDGEMGAAVPQRGSKRPASEPSQTGKSSMSEGSKPDFRNGGDAVAKVTKNPSKGARKKANRKPGKDAGKTQAGDGKAPLSPVEQALARAEQGAGKASKFVAKPGVTGSKPASEGTDQTELIAKVGPMGPPPPFAWHEIQSQAEIELALNAEPAPSMLIVEGDAAPSTEGADAVSEGDEGGLSEADLMAWLDSDEDLPFMALGYAMGTPEMIAPELPSQAESAPAVEEETQAAVALEPAPAVRIEPGPIFVAGMPLTLEPLWPGFEIDAELLQPGDLFDEELLASGLAAPETDVQDPWDDLPWNQPAEEDRYAIAESNRLPDPEPLLPPALPGAPLRAPGKTPTDGFSLGQDPMEWSAQREIAQAEAEAIAKLKADAEAEQAGPEATMGPETPVALVESDGTGAQLQPADELVAGLDDVAAPAEEPVADDLAEFAELLAEAAEAGPDGAAEVGDMPTVEGEAAAQAPAQPSGEVASVELPGGGVTVEVESEIPSAVPVLGPAVALAPSAESRSLLQAYSDWMRIQDMAPGGDPVLSGLTGVPGHENLPYGLAQLGSGESIEANTLDLGVEIGESRAPRRGGVLRRASGDHRWDGVEVPGHAVSVGRKLLTPNVGPVRVNLTDGESLEGRLHAVGFDMVWLETSLGRMSLEQRRVDQIVKLDPRHVLTAPGVKRDYSRFPRVRVTAKGGIFVGHQLNRSEDRITLVTDEGSRITLENVEVMPARQFRSVGLLRGEGGVLQRAPDAGSPASPK